MIRGKLKAIDGGIFNLLPKVTTVGRDGCNLVIQSPSVDSQHAVIEFNEEKNCFFLQDLKTAQGTSVNSCRLQNSSARLKPGDVVRFGSHPISYEFLSHSPPDSRPSPSAPRTAWSSTSSSLSTGQSGLPSLSTSSSSSSLTPAATARSRGDTSSRAGPSITPHPPATSSMKGRPLSAAARINDVELQMPKQINLLQNTSMVRSTPRLTGEGEGSQIEMLHEQVKILNEEVRCLAASEMNGRQKDDLINHLRDEISHLQKHLRQTELHIVDTPATADVRQPRPSILQPEKDFGGKKTETKNMKYPQVKPPIAMTMSQYHSQCVPPGYPASSISPSSPRRSRSQANRVRFVVETETIDTETDRLKREIETMKKDKCITLGLLSQMQKDLVNKDVSIAQLTKLTEELKKELSVKDSHIASLKSNKTNEDETGEFKDKEIALLHYKFKWNENQKLELNELVSSLKKDVLESKTSADKEKQQTNKLKRDVDAMRSKYEDLERAERLVRVAMEQISKRLDLLRSRVVQTAYSYPGANAPDKHLDDDELVASLKAYIDHYADLLKTIKSLEDKEEAGKRIAENTRTMAARLKAIVTRLRAKDHQARHIRSELEAVALVPVEEPFLSDVKDVFRLLLKFQLDWEDDVEKALDEVSAGLTPENNTVRKCISAFNAKMAEESKEISRLKSELERIKIDHKHDLADVSDQLSKEIETKHREELGKVRHEDELKLSNAISEAKKANEEALDAAVRAEKKTIKELENNLQEINCSYDALKIQAASASECLEVSKKMEVELREKLKELESNKSEFIDQMKKELEEQERKYKEERNMNLVEIRQHSLTICALEERLNSTLHKNKEQQIEISALQVTITDHNEKLSKAQMKNENSLLDKTTGEKLLTTENKEMKLKIHDQQSIIMSLRKDLTGATARLTDLTAELNDAQKRALERGTEKIRKQEEEMMKLQQQMARLSDIVDQQKRELEEVNQLRGEEQESIVRLKKEISEMNEEMKKLRNSQKTALIDSNEGCDMLTLGVQCKGERHLQVIERQREALVELRVKLKALDSSEDNTQHSTVDQALYQVNLLQKEFDDLRSTKDPPVLKDIELTATDHAVNRSRGTEYVSKAFLDMEKSAHFETRTSLENSENSYMALVRHIFDALNMDDTSRSIVRSMDHLSPDQGESLAAERNAMGEAVAGQIRTLQKRIERKEELLDGYSGDLSMIREAQDFAALNSKKAETLNDEIRMLKEDIEYLQESLLRMRDQLDREKRLNAAVKQQKKMFHLVRELPLKTGWPKHNCFNDDFTNTTIKARKKVQVVRVKGKKNEEKSATSLSSGFRFESADKTDSEFKLIAVDV